MADRVFIIGANSSVGGELTSALIEAGFITAEAPDYPEALAELEDFGADMVIIDGPLPSRDSLEVCSEVINEFGLPVIIIGKRPSDFKLWQRVMESGADFYQAKPFSKTLLIARVKAILRRYKGEVVKRDDNPKT